MQVPVVYIPLLPATTEEMAGATPFTPDSDSTSFTGALQKGCERVDVREGVSVLAAFVTPREGMTVDRDELLAFAHERLASYKCPREVVIVPALPRSANGKLIRAKLPHEPTPDVTLPTPGD